MGLSLEVTGNDGGYALIAEPRLLRIAPLSREPAGTISSHIHHHSRCKSCSHFQARLLAASFSSP
jgi:hypothetical protein